MSRLHGMEEKAYKCLQCPSRYTLPSHLRSHVRRVHLHEKNHKCRFCSQAYFSSTALKYHESKHEESKEINEEDVDDCMGEESYTNLIL